MNPILVALEIQAVTTGVTYLLSTIKNPESKAKYGALLKALADEIYVWLGLTPVPMP